jgi:hypothetical protein
MRGRGGFTPSCICPDFIIVKTSRCNPCSFGLKKPTRPKEPYKLWGKDSAVVITIIKIGLYGL